METRVVFYETSTGRPPAQDVDAWSLVTGDEGSLEVEHSWKRPRADGILWTVAGTRRCSLDSFFRDEGSDTAKARLRRLLDGGGR